MNDWKTLTLADVCTVITDGAHQSPKTVVRGKPMASVKDLTRFGVDLSNARHIAAEDFEALVRQGCRPKVGDVLIAKDGNSALDTVCTVDQPLDAVLLSSVAILRPDPRLLNSAYLKYYLSSPRTLDYLKSNFISGAAIPRIVLRDFKKAEIRLPGLDSQMRITQILQSLDSKIELNRRINQTLEAMAQAIFKSWFVDFDPVKAKIAAKAEGRDPLRAAMSAISGKTDAELDALPPEQYAQLAAIAALFPNEMEESELGAVPTGWTVSTVGSVATIIKGASYSSKDLVPNAQTALVALKSFERGGGFRMDGFKAYIGSFKPSQVVEPGELIVAYTDVTQAAELIGRPAIVVGVNSYQTLVASLDVGIVRPNQDLVSRQYLYGLFKTDSFQSHTFAHTTGTTVLHLGKNGVPSFKFPRPPTDLIKRFSNVADPVVLMKQRAIDQTLVLTELRDALLPRLLSGELQVQNIEAGAAE